MNDVFYNLASLDKLRGRLTKKNIISLLILSVLTIALFPASTAAFASSNVRESNASATDNTLMSIHMLDKTHGWAMTQSSVLKTADGGLHWQNVIPAGAFNDVPLGSTPQGTFLNDQDAWVVIPVVIPPDTAQDTIRVLRTTDGGKSWQNSIIHTSAGSRSDMPHFLNPSNGWLQTFGQAGSSDSTIFYTTDGGLHWNEPGKLNTKDIPYASGISFIDNQNGWEAGNNPTAAIDNAQPLLEVTHDGGKTWQSQSLPALPGADKSAKLSTKPPVFFGMTGLLPVSDQIIPPKTPGIGLDLYVTHNGGQTWTPTPLVTSNIPGNKKLMPFTIDVMDMQHAWAILGTDLYATSNGGQSWTKLPSAPQSITELNFVDANTGWAITPTNLLHTTDGGHTWQPINYFIDGKLITPPPIANPKPVGSSGKDCGFLLYGQAAGANTGPTLLPDPGDQPHVACFLQAFQQCVPKTISFVVDSKGPTTTTTENDFSTKPQSGSCAISKNVNVNMKPQPNKAETCARVAQTGTNLSFIGCTKSGTITFPLVAPK